MHKHLAAALLAIGSVLYSAASFGQTPATGQVGAGQAGADAQAEPQARVIAPDDQPTREQLDRLFEVMQLRQQMSSVMKVLPAMMQQQISQQIKTLAANKPSGSTMTPEQQADLEKLTKKFMEKAINLYTPEEMFGDLSGIYQKHLSREDVDGMIAFYSSPAGQHMLQMTPVVMKEYMPLVTGRMQERTKALIEEMNKEIKEAIPGLVSPTDAPTTN
jgi:uncharacterized protein